MFPQLSDKLQEIFKELRGHGIISESNIDAALRQVRLALLEADVDFQVARNFVASVKEKALGETVVRSITPGQQIVKIFHDELTALLGGDSTPLQLDEQGRILMVGLNGSGKTTSSAKLARFLQKQDYSPVLVPCDLQRPAAVEQLVALGKQIGAAVVAPDPSEKNVQRAAAAAVGSALPSGARSIYIFDTAGRQEIDEALIQELKKLKEFLQPQETLLVVDAATGQQAVSVATHFDNALSITGIILTKLDGDARGGAALSINYVTGQPIKFVGVGEKYDALEVFYPDRIVSRILGMGDVLSLIEKAEQTIDKQKALEVHRKLQTDTFTLEDFRDQLRQMRRLGPMDEMLGMLPKVGIFKDAGKVRVEEKELIQIEAIIDSMTPQERSNHEIINGKRRKRIARGSGTSVQQVNQVLKQYFQMRKMMKSFSQNLLGKQLGRLKVPVGTGGAGA